MNASHIWGILLKNILLIKGSFPRLSGMFIWITFELFLWGFVTSWLNQAAPGAGVDFALVLLSALIFWDIFQRGQHSFSFAFLEDIWARNIINVFAAPLKLRELLAGFVLVGALQAFIAFIYISLLALLLFALNVWTLGFAVIPLFLNLLFFGWVMGLFTIGILLRFGPSAEMFAFFIPFALLPFAAVFNPVSALPEFMQQISLLLPPAHLFEGMRTVLLEGTLPWSNILSATLLNMFYFALGLAFFSWMLRLAKKRGLIARLVTD